MKKLIKLAVLAVLLVVVLGILSAYYLDNLIKSGVETVGPKLTKTDVTLARANVSPLSGKGDLYGFVVGNPEGYKAPHAISLGRVHLSVQPRSLMSEKIIIKSFVAEAPEITLEGGLKDNNLTKILENVNAVTGGGGEAKPETPAEEAGQTKIQVDEFLIKGATVKYSLKLLGGQTLDLRLPDLELRNLGQGEEGITTGELTRLVLNEITASVVRAAGDKVGGLGGQATEALQNLKESGAGQAADAIKNLFKKD